MASISSIRLVSCSGEECLLYCSIWRSAQWLALEIRVTKAEGISHTPPRTGTADPLALGQMSSSQRPRTQCRQTAHFKCRNGVWSVGKPFAFSARAQFLRPLLLFSSTPSCVPSFVLQSGSFLRANSKPADPAFCPARDSILPLGRFGIL